MDSPSQIRKRAQPQKVRVHRNLTAKISTSPTGAVLACRTCADDNLEAAIPPAELQRFVERRALGQPCATPTCDGKIERLTLNDLEGSA